MEEQLESEVNQVVRGILEGGVALVPTDTVYGLAVSPLRSDAVTRLYELKGRPTRQHLPIMVASRNDLVPLGVEINTNV